MSKDAELSRPCRLKTDLDACNKFENWRTETLAMGPKDGNRGSGWSEEELSDSSLFSDDEHGRITGEHRPRQEEMESPRVPPPPPFSGPSPFLEREDSSAWELPEASSTPNQMMGYEEPTLLGPTPRSPDLQEFPTSFPQSADAEGFEMGTKGARPEEQPLYEELDQEANLEPAEEPTPGLDPRQTAPPTPLQERRSARGTPFSRAPAPPSPFATPSMMAPSDEYDGAAPALVSYRDFRRETLRLARTRDYQSIATLHESALASAAWASPNDLHIKLLLDLAKLYRDRLADRVHAQNAFERLIQRRPGHSEAMDFLKEDYEAQGEMRKLHDLYATAVDDEWSPERRIELTRLAARIALDHLNDPTIAAQDWERLLEFGDIDGRVAVELSQVYREAKRWPDLGQFLETRAAACAGTTRVAVLREAIESFLSGAKSPDRAETLINHVLDESPDDPIALASLSNVRAQQGQWAELESIALREMADVPAAARLDVLRHTAQLLAAAGEHDRAATAYERVLHLAPNDRDAIAAKEKYLTRKGDHQGLVEFLVARADKSHSQQDKAQLFERAAQVADSALHASDRAAELWLQSVEAQPNNPKAYEALVAIYDQTNDIQGVTKALEGLATITREPKARAAVMRRLGDHYAYRAQNDDEAQRCWLEVASILPDDFALQKELNGIHKRRGDFAALDMALTRQLWRMADTESALELAREIATNLNENLDAEDKTVRACMHVLNLAPDAQDALEELTSKLSARDTTEVQGILEKRLSLLMGREELESRVAIGLEIASNWEKRGDHLAALAAYERVRAWAPTDDRVLEPLVRLHAATNPSAALSVLEIASANASDSSTARELLTRTMPLVPDEQPRQRLFLLHRFLRFDSKHGLGEVVEAATSAEAWKELAALYERLAESADSPEMHRTFRLHLARVCEENLADPHRAFIALQSLALMSAKEDDRAALTRLAESTNRWEDLLAVLDATLCAQTPQEERQALLRQRAEICEKHLKDPRRAFLELQRLMQGRVSGNLDDNESQALEYMHKLAVENNLLFELEAVYGELWDRAPDDDVRVSIARARQAIRGVHLDDPAGALEQALVILRLLPNDESVANEVIELSEQLSLWEHTLPVLEGVWRAKGDQPDKLVRLAQLYRDKCENPARAAELLSEALRMQAHDDETLSKLDALGEQTSLWPRIVLATQLGAAQCSSSPRGLQLAQKVANLYADKLQDVAASLDTHRWILQVWPDEVGSLETVINAHREAQETADLRSRLEQWIEHVEDPSRHVERWLEIGRLCREQLDDAAGALVAFSNVIELDPANDEAAEAMQALGDVELPVGLRKKQVRVELKRATGSRRVALLEQLASLEQEMDETDAAVAALSELFALDEGRDKALQPLADLLRKAERWEELATLEEQAAEKVDSDVALEHLRMALQVSEEQLEDPERLERLLRKVLILDPSDNDAFVRLTRQIRNAGRFEELATELKTRLTEHADGLDQPMHIAMRRELIRLVYLTQQDGTQAEILLQDHPLKPAKPDPDDAVWLATIMAVRGEHAKYIEQRRQHLVKLPKRLAALVVCHLAEYCDQFMKVKGRVLALYREARTIDPHNSLASDALRGLGRGVKTWRSASALLTEPGEESMTVDARAQRLF